MLASDFFHCEKTVAQAYQRACAAVCRNYALSQTALDVLLFIANNPGFNTARDICEVRGIKSGIASVTVESLIQAGLLLRERDARDRRLQRLLLTPRAAPPVAEGQAVQKRFFTRLFRDLSPEEREACARTMEKIAAAARAMESDTEKERLL